MNIKPFILAVGLVSATVVFSACSNHEKPRIPTPVIKKAGDFTWHNEPLKGILDELVERYNVKLCNPQGVIGVSVSGVIPQGKSIDQMCTIVNRIEAGNAYILYLDGTVYVSKTPFPTAFSPDSLNWPCNENH